MTAFRTPVTAGVAAAAALCTVAVWAGGCAARSTRAPAPGPTTAVSATPGTSPSVRPTASDHTAPPVYQPVGNLCTVVDAAPLRGQAGEAQPQPVARHERISTGTRLSCTVRLGSLGNAGAVTVAADIYHSRPARQEFEKLRAEEAGTSPVPGVGAGAYSYVDSINRPVVAAYDANLHLIVMYTPNRPLNNPQALIPALTEVTRNTIAALYRHGSSPGPGGGLRRPA